MSCLERRFVECLVSLTDCHAKQQPAVDIDVFAKRCY